MNNPYTRAPHFEGPHRPLATEAPNAALLIDFDNVTMGMHSDLSKELKSLLNSDIIKGKVAVQRAYADWRRYPQYIVPLSEASIDLIFAPAYGSSKKNATDIRLAIDALELVFTRPEIGVYILLSGDSDFSSLVIKLKEYGKYVIGVGIQESSSDILVQNCDEYYSYTALAGLRKTVETGGAQVDPWVLVERALDQMEERDDVMRSDRLKQVMLEIDPGFQERTYGFSKFSRFLSEASSRGLVVLKRLENGQYEVHRSKSDEPRAEGSGSAAPRLREKRDRREGRRSDDRPESPAKERKAARGQDSRRARADDGKRGAKKDARPGDEAGSKVAEEKREPRGKEPEDLAEDPLKAAYVLLHSTVSELVERSGKEAVRDSDVKRRMLALNPSFDESELGFGKFSRFLRQAHDHEIVDLRKRDTGNYEVSLTKRDERQEVVSRVEEAPGREAAEVRPSEEGRDEEIQTRPVEGKSAAASPTRATTPEQTVVATGRRLGPRRGSRRGRHTDEGPPPVLDGQTIGAPAGTARWSEEYAPGDGQASREVSSVERIDPAALGLPSQPDSVVRYLSSRYKGVGRRTAETLVEAFGASTFQVLHTDPDRVREIIPSARAEKVLEEWRADLRRRVRSGEEHSGAAAKAELPAAGPAAGEENRSGRRFTTRRRTRRTVRKGRGRGDDGVPKS
jgi:uncharacterized protein (TIGR00288 family)